MVVVYVAGSHCWSLFVVDVCVFGFAQWREKSAFAFVGYCVHMLVV